MRAVVMDGDALVDITKGVDVQIITADAENIVTIQMDGDASIELNADADVELETVTSGEFGVITTIGQGDLPWYTGATEVTPSVQRQVLETANHAVASNIVINPIPSNYGLITWNGSTLTVS